MLSLPVPPPEQLAFWSEQKAVLVTFAECQQNVLLQCVALYSSASRGIHKIQCSPIVRLLKPMLV